MKLTVELLREAGIYGQDVRIFEEIYPKGTLPTLEALATLAAGGFHWGCLTESFLDKKEQEAVRRYMWSSYMNHLGSQPLAVRWAAALDELSYILIRKGKLRWKRQRSSRRY